MRIPTIHGVIDRRILANYRIDGKVMATALPQPFRPQLIDGYAVGGICLIRLKQVRPWFFPLPFGIGSENAAHRIAVEWDTDSGPQFGVYIPRRDTNSRLNAWAGGRIFPGVHHHASFDVDERGDHVSVQMNSSDGSAHVKVVGQRSVEFPESSVFRSLEEASLFFEQGALGYSDTGKPGQFDGLELDCTQWKVDALSVSEISSSYFEDTQRFPKGSVEFDCGLLMRDIPHRWHGRPDLCCG